MKSGVNSRLATTGLNLPTDLFKQRLAATIGYARSQRRESWWYSPWSDALTYLCLATSTAVAGSGVDDTERGRGASFYLCPQQELLRDVLRPQSTPLPLCQSLCSVHPAHRHHLTGSSGEPILDKRGMFGIVGKHQSSLFIKMIYFCGPLRLRIFLKKPRPLTHILRVSIPELC